MTQLTDFLLVMTVKVSMITALALGVTAMMHRRSAALRHWVLAMSIIGAAILPAAGTTAPAWDLPAMPWIAPSNAPATTLTSAQPPAGTPFAPADTPAPPAGLLRQAVARPAMVAGVTWLTGVSVALTVLAAGLWRLRRVARSAAVVDDGRIAALAAHAAAVHGVRRRVLLLLSSHPTLVVTWGTLRPRVLLPAAAVDWSDDRLRVVLHHELAHVRRGDWGIQIVASLLRCAYWFNPFLWIACRRLRHESEHASDDLVLGAGVSGADYATHLLEVARDTVRLRPAWMPATAIAHPSTLEGRIRAMLNDTLDRSPLGPKARLATALATLVLALAVAGAGLAAADAAPSQAGAPEWKTYVRETQESLRVLAAETGALPSADPSAASAQSAAQAASSLVGAVYDQLGGLLPGVSITLTQAESGSTYQSVSDATGTFTFRDLPSGAYALETRLPGFATVRTVVTVDRNTTVKRNISLPLGSLQETITVTGERPGAAGSDVAPSRRRPAVQRIPRTIPDPRQATFAFAGGIGGNIKVPTKMVNVNPIYPAEMQAAGKSAVVVLVARIGIDGYVSDLQPAENLDADPSFIASAITAVQQWEFNPALLNGVPIDVDLTISVQYDLR